MPTIPFVHLHLHSEYSLLDGAIRLKDLVAKTAAYEMPAVALTDHGNLFGAIEFYQKATAANIKPIIGCEMYIAPGSMHEKKGGNQRESAYHLTLLASNSVGYHNLIKLTTAAHLEGFYYKPRIDKELLAKHSEGLIALSGCLKGEINMALSGGEIPKATALTAEYRDIFGKENFFIELSDHGIEAQRRNRSPLIQLATDFDLQLVATNDVHFLERAHHDAHDVMICIGTGAMVADEKRMHYVPELYFKSGEEMARLFADRPDAITNTLQIAERCNLTLEFNHSKYPDYPPPEGKTRDGFLRELCDQGLRRRFGERAHEDASLQQRLDYELSVLEKTGFVSYFLIVWDFIHYAKEQGIPVGPGRGSAAGSLVAYVLGITDLDPLRYGLIFERFLNPDRISPPDIDIDFCQNRRGEVIDYVRAKYGERSVAQIITFGTMGAKSVIRDVGRVLGWGYNDADRISKMIPNELNITLNGSNKKGKHEPGAIDKNPELKKAVEEEQATAQLWGYASFLEGLTRNSGVHAAGIVIADRDLSEYIPLTRGNEGSIVSQYSMAPLTDLGLLKMDFLGLTTLTVMADAIKLIHQKKPDFSLEKIPIDDAPTFALLNRGDSVGVFQLESGGMTNVAKRLQVDRFEDLIALIALYRPGPMQFIDDYIERKKGTKKIVYAHPLLEKICSETYGIIVYQEQVQQAANALAGYTLGQADLLRRAMGKKDKEKMAKERITFVTGCKELNKIPEKQANAIFDFLEKFAEYGFNKSHSAAYALISYQTAYLKANYPVEFMAGLLSNAINNTEKITTFVTECARMEISILPPDVNASGLTFLPEQHGTHRGIRFGLSAIKNVGTTAMANAIVEREANGLFESLEDFCCRLDSKSVNRKILESLIKSGAFDFDGRHRAELLEALESAISAAASIQRDRASGQASLFDDFEVFAPKKTSSTHPNREIPAWPASLQLSYEKELLGFYVTGHPLDDYRGTLEKGNFTPLADLLLTTEPAKEKVAGLITSIEKKFTKKEGKPFAIALLEDFTGSLEFTVWSEAFTQHEHLLQTGTAISCNLKIIPRDGAIRAIASDFKALTPLASKKAVRLKCLCTHLTSEDLDSIQKEIQKYPGSRPLILEFVNADGKSLSLRTDKAFGIDDEHALKKALKKFLI
ncbi:MAG: DNA polymerase III subunit alpha [Verrucomicrobia bacterium RIFCSPHIGHO2_12_FULL_41_10]|nr:MAG: DNA polymerase III subunit alpha [Verrucomicrobia bacterium RIFCSPHIGHO2_12_FULL_41_10]HLB34897.1 DNA polymerase III subunit alpha [Chthoniobacterales bacterium]